ncbi:hypothetical protein [Streptomyces lasalocidi]|uniref:Uncharacterized protein n=1 Tax=Streptomyces lasalocidi TaxID=324833 RepID=A0A4U5W470_STRLS|nr:hypothetical protein [Streptomyces lasalocidi]TKS96224.1 hypothetical protein E4U91_36510 [Streptomyces lasalocidi]
MQDRTSPGAMTIRVYTVDRRGTVTSDAGTRSVKPATNAAPPLRQDTYYPPCKCHLHRGEAAR